MEKSVEVQTILTNYHCDDCDDRITYEDGRMLLGNPPLFEHQCTGCKRKYTFYHKYPIISYKYQEKKDITQ